MAKAGAVPLLVNLLVYGSKRAQAAAAWSLWRLTCSEHTRSLVADKRYVSIVNNVLGAGNASARIAACGCLADIAEGSPERLSLVVDAGSVSSMTRLLSPDGLDETPPQNRIPRLSALQLPGVWAKVAEGMREAKAMDRVASAAMVGRRRESLVETAERVQSELEKDSGRPLGEDPVKVGGWASFEGLVFLSCSVSSSIAVLCPFACLARFHCLCDLRIPLSSCPLPPPELSLSVPHPAHLSCTSRFWVSRQSAQLFPQDRLPGSQVPLFMQDSVMWSLWRLHDMEKQAGSGTAVLDVILDGDTVPAAVQMLNSGSYHGRHGAAGLLGSIAERGPTVQVSLLQRIKSTHNFTGSGVFNARFCSEPILPT